MAEPEEIRALPILVIDATIAIATRGRKKKYSIRLKIERAV